MGNQTMAVQYDHPHEAMAKARLLFEDFDNTGMEDINNSYSPFPKNLKPCLLYAQMKRAQPWWSCESGSPTFKMQNYNGAE
jgi:hypothetical protein